MLYYLSSRRLPTAASEVSKLDKKAHIIQQLRMCQGFAAAGTNVCLVFPGTEEPSWEFLSEYYGLTSRFELQAVSLLSQTYSFPNYPIPDTDDQAVSWWLLKMLLLGQFDANDVVYSRNPVPTRHLLFARRWASTGDAPSIWFEQHQVDRGLADQFYERVDGLICISARQKQRLLRTIPADAETIHVAHDGVDLAAYRDRSAAAARRQLGVPPDERVVMYTGHLYPSKGVETLVRAAADVDAQCYVVGGYDADRRRLKRELSVPLNVTFTGFVPPAQIPLYQLAADVLVATVAEDTGEYEFFSPLKVFEYMAAGKPLVLSRKPAYEEVLSHGRNGLFVSPGSTEELARTVNRLLSCPGVRLQLGQQARRDVARYSWCNRARRILSRIGSNAGRKLSTTPTPKSQS